MPAIKGIRQSLFCDKDTLLEVSPTNAFSPGLSTENKLIYEDVPVTDYREGALPDKVNHKFNSRSNQVSFLVLSRLVNLAIAGGCDLQVVTEKQAAAVYGGVYNYTGNKRFMGFDFEYVIGTKERYCDLNFECSMDYQEHNYLLQDALTASPRDLSTLSLGVKGVQPGLYRNPNFEALQHPVGTTLVNGYEIVDRKLTMKTVSGKLEFDRSDLQWFQFILEVTVNKAKAAELVSHFANSRYASIRMQERVSPSVVEMFNFGEGVMWRKHMVEIGKDKRDIKFTFQRNITPYDLNINTSTNILTVTEVV